MTCGRVVQKLVKKCAVTIYLLLVPLCARVFDILVLMWDLTPLTTGSKVGT